MSHNIYGLLVGIDKYMKPVPPLKGCVNDIVAIQEYLEGRVANGEFQLHLRKLINQEATRQAVIDGFQQHLRQADSEDVVLFYFAGHGSQESAPPEFWYLEPDRMNETLVCYDSRTEGRWDLADKELAKLLSEVAEKNPHIVVILDCCHSGSGTRGELDLETAVRHTLGDRRERPLESFIFSSEELEHLSTIRHFGQNLSGWTLPRGKHVLLAACRDIEKAKECNVNGQRRGAFSYFLVDTLQKANGSLTYRDLFKRTYALVRSKVMAQSPQLETTVSAELDQMFLGGAIAPRTPYFTVIFDRDYGWVIDGGIIHGVPQPVAGQTTLLALFPFDSPIEQLHKPSAALGEAQVLEVLPQLSKIRITGVEELHPETTFKAVITGLPLPRLGVWIEGEATGTALAQQSLATAEAGNRPSLYVQEVPKTETAEFRLIAKAGQYLITRPVDDRPLVDQINDFTPASAAQAIQRLEHIARWTTIAELSSPATSRIRPDVIRMQIYQNGQELNAPETRLEYRQEGDKQKQPTFQLKLRNNGNEPLYCAVLNLTERYAVSAELFATGGVWLRPGEEAWAAGGQPLYASVPKQMWEQGVTEVKDIFKLIVSTAEFDATLLEQGNLDLPRTHATRSLTTQRKGTLNRLMNRVQTRQVRLVPEEDELYDDWITSQVTITTVRPTATKSIPNGTESISLGSGVQLQPHSKLRAQARLTTVTQATRDIGIHLLPPILLQDDALTQPFQFTPSRGVDPGLSALELNQVTDASVVTSEEPLKLTVDAPLEEEEHLLPIAYDGDFFLPLGYGKRTANGKTEIVLERLPDPIPALENASEERRSLGSVIYIFFQKTANQIYANQYLQKGVRQAQSGNLQEAAHSLEQTLVLFRQFGDQQGEGQALGNLGLVYHFLGDYDRAAEYHQQSLVLDQELANPQSVNQSSTTDYLWGEYTTERRVGDRKSYGYTLFNLGFTYYWQNDYAKAIESYLSSLETAKEIDDRANEIRVLAQLGEVYFYLADYYNSIQYHQQALELTKTLETTDAISSQGNSLNSLGNAYNKLGDWEQAKEHYERALAVLSNAGNPNAQGNALAGIGIAYANQNQHVRAIEYLEQSVPLFQSVPNRYNEGRVYNLLGQSYSFLDNYEQAIEHQQRSLEISKSLGEPFSEAIVLAELGLVFFKGSKLVEAEEKLQQAIHLSETIRAKLGSDDALKVSIFERQAEPYQLLQIVLANQNKIEAALEISERGRARAFVELLSQRLTASSESSIVINSPQVNQIRRIAATHNATLVEYSIIQTKGLEPTILIWVIKPNGEITLRQVNLQSSNDQSISLEDLVFETREGMGLRSLEAFACSGEVHELGRDITLHPEAEELHLHNTAKLQVCYQLLIQPIAELLPGLPEERVIIIPQGPLFLLPFAALINANGNYLIEQHTILISPSIQSLALTHQAQQRLRQTELQESLVVGNPTMPQIALRGEQIPRVLQPLPGAEEEAKAVAPILGTRALIGSQATKTTVLSEMLRARIIHLATHGFFDDARGLGSAIVLASSDENGLLTAEEIFQLNLQAELAVLSACNTGRGRVTGDGVIGLSRSFIAAGVPSVIVSLWAVLDAPTAFLMSEFYRQLQTYSDKAQALRQAMRTTMQHYPSPINWGAFVLIGEADCF